VPLTNLYITYRLPGDLIWGQHRVRRARREPLLALHRLLKDKERDWDSSRILQPKSRSRESISFKDLERDRDGIELERERVAVVLIKLGGSKAVNTPNVLNLLKSDPCCSTQVHISTYAGYWSRADLGYTKRRHSSKENMILKRNKFTLYGHQSHNRMYYDSFEIRAFLTYRKLSRLFVAWPSVRILPTVLFAGVLKKAGL